MIVAESELVGVSLQMLRGNMVESPVKRPLHLRPESFNGVGVGLASDIFAMNMVNHFMLIAHASDLAVGGEVVGHDLGAGNNIAVHDGLNSSQFPIGNDLNLNPSFSFNASENNALSLRCPVSLPNLYFFLPPDVGIINFNHAGKRICTSLHQLSNLVSDAPSALVSYAKLPFKLLGRYAVLALAHKENSMEPRNQRCGALVENRAFRGIDLVSAGASVRAPAFNGIKVSLLALRALKTFGIAVLEDMRQARFVVGEVFLEVFDCVFHDFSITGDLLVVKG